MNLVQLVDSLSDIAVPQQRYYGGATYSCVPLSSVLERATEEQMIELGEVIRIYGYDLNTVMSKNLDRAFVYINIHMDVGFMLVLWGT